MGKAKTLNEAEILCIIISMKRLDKKENDQQADEKLLRRASILLIVLVLVLFGLIVGASYVVEHFYGKTAGIVFLVIVAAVIGVLMYRKEIRNLFRKKDDQSK